MKKNYVTIISLLIICAAVLIYVTTDRDTPKSPQRLHGYVDPATLQSVTIARGDRSIDLVPRGTEWFLQDKDLLIEVDAGKMLSLLEFINAGTIVQRVTEKPETYARFDLSDETALTVSLQTEKKLSTIYVGKNKDHASQFVRLPDDPAVYLVSKTLDSGPEPWRWYFRRVLQYDPELLDAVLYDCGGQTVHLQHDAANGTLTVRDVPDGRTGADLGTLAEAFRGLSIGEYKPREQIPQSEPLVTHTLYFTDGSSAKLRFLDRDDEKGLAPYLDIVFGDTKPSDKTLQNARSISMQYAFSLSWIDPAKYLKECGDFFIDPPTSPVTDNSEPAHADCADCPETSE